MRPLPELQAAFLSALRGGADDVAPASRMAVYRANYVGNLTNSLRLTYPVIEKLVGAEFFDDMAEVFIDENPPRSGNMNDYGAGFGDFLAGFEPVAQLAYLPGVARLEWALFVAATAAELPPLTQEELAALTQKKEDDIFFVLHPALGLVRDDFPVDAVRAAVQADDEAGFAALDMKSGPVFLAVTRSGDDVRISRVSEEEWNFLKALGVGENLARALDAAAGFDAGAALGAHLAAGNLLLP